MTTPVPETATPIWLRPPALIVFVVLAFAVRYYVGAATGLVRDEGYYALWSFYPQLGYLDHPPMIAWLIGLGRMILGESEAAIRLAAVIATTIISLAVWRIGRLLFNARTGALALILYTLIPASGLLFVATPDTPAVMFWTLALWAVAEFASGRSPMWWLAAGVFAGLGLLSKYSVGFLGLGLLLYLLTSRERRAWLKLWQLWAGGALALLVFMPNVLWNAARDWLTFRFQGGRLVDVGLNLGSAVENLKDLFLGQLLVSGVVLFLLAAIGIIAFFLRANRPGRENLALPILTSLPIILYFLAYTLRFRVEANWLLPVWPMLALAGAWATVHLGPPSRTFARAMTLARWAAPLAGLWLVGIIYVQALWQPLALGQALDRTRDMRGWDGLQEQVAALAAANDAGWITTAADYGLAGELATYDRINGSALPVRPLDEPHRWLFLPRLDAAVIDAPAVFVAPGWVSEAQVAGYFGNVERVGEAQRLQRDEVLERFEVYLVSRPLPATRDALARD